MNIYIRADSSVQIGSGHVMRCLTLADTLREKGASISFICRELPGNLCNHIERKGYQVHRLPREDAGENFHAEIDAKETEIILKKETTAQWLIVDHYALDHQWETRMRPLVSKIMVIDDLADRHHDCDVLLDQNLYQNQKIRYEALVPAQCTKLLGPEFALLRAEFIDTRKTLRNRDGNVKRILIFFGGVDPTNETSKALEAVAELKRPDIAVDVVVGGANPHKEQIRQLCAARPNTIIYCQIDTMARLMACADLAIGAGGSTTWERCCLGLPAIVLTIADNQVPLTVGASDVGAVDYAGSALKMSKDQLLLRLQDLLVDSERMRTISRCGFKLVDGAGAARVAELLG
jgi:UDP-2,4-diacetamido-2,4,6-trideoxy-beta-L-altropyranose hydrolase